MAKYWCKPCKLFVDDTKFGRSQHEKSSRHQTALQRQLQQLHDKNRLQEDTARDEKRELDRMANAAAKTVVKGGPNVVDSSGTKNTISTVDTLNTDVTGKPLKLKARIAEVDASKTIDPTPEIARKKVELHASHEFLSWKVQDKVLDKADLDLDGLGSEFNIKEETKEEKKTETKPKALFKKRNVAHKVTK